MADRGDRIVDPRGIDVIRAILDVPPLYDAVERLNWLAWTSQEEFERFVKMFHERAYRLDADECLVSGDPAGV
jgi:hypothetical protein